VVSDDLTLACSDLAAWGQEEGIALFVIHTTEAGGVRFIGPQLPTALVAKMLRDAADGYEAQVTERTIQ
jgi:hypothetical protein